MNAREFRTPATPLPSVLPADARLTMFGPDGNEGLALQVYDLCQSDETPAWEEAACKLLEMLHAVRRVLITRMAEETPRPICPVVTRAEIDQALKERTA